MTIPAKCGGCGHVYRVDEDKAGKRFKCKECGQAIVVPRAVSDDDTLGDSGELEASVPAQRRPPRRKGTTSKAAVTRPGAREGKGARKATSRDRQTAEESTLGHRIGMRVCHGVTLAVVCLHIIAVVCLLGNVMVFWAFNFSADALASPDETGKDLAFGVGLLVFGLAMIAGIEFVVYGLRRRKFWAWVAGLCIFGMFLPSLFLPLSAFGLRGLLDSGSRKEFGVSGGTGPA